MLRFLFLNKSFFFLLYLRQSKQSAFLWYLGLVSSLHSWLFNVAAIIDEMIPSFFYFNCIAWLVHLTLIIRHHPTFYLPCFDKSLDCLAISQKVLDDLLWEVFLLLISVICWESQHNRVYARINLRQVHRVHFRLAMTVKKSTEPPITLLPNQLSPQGKNKHVA